MVNTNKKETRSSLEMMLDKIQQVENQPKDSLPALPVRPVSKARLPRSRRPLPFEYLQRRNNFEDHDIEELENSKEKVEKGISIIQKWYRGYQVRCQYKELRRVAISLQSFVRGENARRNYKYKARLIDHEFIQVPYNVLIDIQKRVLRTEAKLREKKDENIVLKTRVKEIDMKWQQYEERMKFMEKKWQDELIYIQKCLAACKKNQALEIRFDQNPDTNRIILTGNTDKSKLVDECRLVYEDGNHSEQVSDKLHSEEELRKLKFRFEEWKKDYKNKLREARLAFKKLGNFETSKIQKHWWGRLS